MRTVTAEIRAISDIENRISVVRTLSTALALMGAGVHRLPAEEGASEAIVHVAYLLRDLIDEAQDAISALKEGGTA